MAEKLKPCPACGKDVASSAKTCPHCGKKLKMGLFLKLVIGIVGLVVLVAILQPSAEDQIKSLESAQPSALTPTGELAATFKMGSDHTDLQRDNLEKKIKGQVVQWTLPVFEVDKRGDGYRVQTSGNEAMLGLGTPVVGAFLTIYPRNAQERAFIEQLKTGDMISFKGRIKGTTIRNIDVDPAVLVSK